MPFLITKAQGTPFARRDSHEHATAHGQIRLARRVGRSLPWIGAAIALYTLGSAISRKGLLGGTLDTALNAVPVVGGVKNAAEIIRGRDFIRDRAQLATPNPIESRLPTPTAQRRKLPDLILDTLGQSPV